MAQRDMTADEIVDNMLRELREISLESGEMIVGITEDDKPVSYDIRFSD
jgi:hypothetical protein